MNNLTLNQASAIVDATIVKGRELNLRPLTIAVLDSGGHLVAFKRENGSGILRAEIAIGKAWGSLGMGVPSRTFSDRATKRPAFFNALAVASQGKFFPVPGGVLIRDKDQTIIGAVGVTGDTGENDEFCAIEGVKAAGLISDPPSQGPD